MGDQVRQWWLSAAAFSVIAVIVALATGPQLSRKRTAQGGNERRQPNERARRG